MLNFKCPACGKERQLAEKARGRKFRCLDCHAKVKHHADGRFEVLDLKPASTGNASEADTPLTLQTVAIELGMSAAPDPQSKPQLAQPSEMTPAPAGATMPAKTAPAPTQEAAPAQNVSAPVDPIPAPQVALDKMTGKVVGNYLLIGLLGSGATSHVYLAEHQALKRRLAVKIMSRSLTSTPEKVAKLLNEAVALAKVDHPNVVRVYDFGTSDGIPFMAMEFVDGQTLDQAIKLSGVLPSERLTTLASELLQGLKSIHEAGLLHRDIKPGNVLIAREGNAKLVDFGLARDIPEPDEPRTAQFSGTAEYAAPELAVGRPPDLRSDLYALGATLYKAAAGRVPFTGSTVAEKLNKQLYEPLVPPHIYNSKVPVSLEQLILKLMSKEPEQRPSSCLEASNLLSPPSKTAPVTRRAVRTKGRMFRTGSSTSSSTGIIVTAAVLLLAGAVAFLATRTNEKKVAGQSKPPPPTVEPAPPAKDSTSSPGERATSGRTDPNPAAVASVLLLRQGTYFPGLVTFSGDHYSVVANGETVRIHHQEVNRWFKSSQEMTVDAEIAGREARELYDRAMKTSDSRSGNAFLRQAVDQAQLCHDRYEVTRKYFSTGADRWLDETITRSKEQLKLIREAELSSRIKGTPGKAPGDSGNDPARKEPFDTSMKVTREKALAAAVSGLLSAPANDPVARKNLRGKLLATAGPGSGALHTGVLIFLSRSEYDWGTMTDELTLSSASIQYKKVPGRVLKKSLTSTDFELNQGGLVLIKHTPGATIFTPPGGESQTASDFSIAEDVKTKQADAVQDYLKILVNRDGSLDRKAHLELARQLRTTILGVRKSDVACSVSALTLLMAIHLNVLMSEPLSDQERAEVDALCLAAGFIQQASPKLWGTPVGLELTKFYEAVAKFGTGGASLSNSPLISNSSVQLVLSYDLLQKAVSSGTYKDYLAASSSLDNAATSSRSAMARDHFTAIAAGVRQSTPCKTCGGKHTLAIACKECKGTSKRDYGCAPCGGHGFIMVLGGVGLVRETCNSCNGQGMFRNQPCKMCKAAGALDCKDCKEPGRNVALGDIVDSVRCGMCGGQGLIFRNPVLECYDCLGLGQCLTPKFNPTKIVSRPLREKDTVEIVKPMGIRMARTVLAPFNGRDLADCEFPTPERKSCWSADQGKLVCDNQDVQNDAMLQFAKAKAGDVCSLSLEFAISKDSLQLPGSFAVEFTAPGGIPRWVVVVNAKGGMNIQKYDGSQRKWIWLVPSRAVFKAADLSNWNQLEVSIQDGNLVVVLNGQSAMNAEIDQDLQGGYVGLRSRGGIYYFKDLLFRTGAK